MEKRTLVEFIVALVLILFGITMTILPIINYTNIKVVFIGIIALYGVIHLIKNLIIVDYKEWSGFETALSSMVILVIMFFKDIKDNPWNLTLLLLIWIILMSLTKLKESDYYHDRKNKLWKLNLFNLLLFIITGLLTAVNLYNTSSNQIVVLGFFFTINGILELMDPLVAYIINNK